MLCLESIIWKSPDSFCCGKTPTLPLSLRSHNPSVVNDLGNIANGAKKLCDVIDRKLGIHRSTHEDSVSNEPSRKPDSLTGFRGGLMATVTDQATAELRRLQIQLDKTEESLETANRLLAEHEELCARNSGLKGTA